MKYKLNPEFIEDKKDNSWIVVGTRRFNRPENHQKEKQNERR